MAHETHFTDGTEITPYLATAFAEGFCEGEDATGIDQTKAWSYLCGTKLGYSLQGWFGRTIRNNIENGYMTEDGTVDWDLINQYLDPEPTDRDESFIDNTDNESYINMEEL